MMNGALGGMVGSPIMALFWIVLLVAGVYVLVRLASSRRGESDRPGRTKDPEDVLKQRYARGELSRDDYERMLQDLRR